MALLARAPPLLPHHQPPHATAHFLLQLPQPTPTLQRRTLSARASDSDTPQQVNLSVLRFTVGIPGLDESYLPRWIGLGFGALVLNRLLSPSPTPAQLRSEALGLCLAAFSATLPYLGRFLEGAGAAGRVPLPEGSRQVFMMPDERAEGGYGLGDVCSAEEHEHHVRDTQLGKILPQGILSVLAQPVLSNPDPANGEAKAEGIILLASNANYAYSEKDRVWIRTVANKFRRA